MVRSIVEGGLWKLVFPEGEWVLHAPGKPFAGTLRREKTYAADRGTVKETVTETDRTALTKLTETEDGLVLSGGPHSLRIRISPLEGGLKLGFTGEEGRAYQFSLPAEAGRAVFGGGEQYRQVNLAGETVVNFVSEHIKASTILEKALLPRKLYKEKPHSQIGSYAPMPVFVTDERRMILFSTPADGIAELGTDAFRFT